MEITIEQVKELIKTEYGSLSEFCRVVGRDRYELQKFFAATKKKQTPERTEELYVLQSEALNHAEKVFWIDDNVRLQMKMAIKRAGGVSQFCKDNPEFKNMFVYEALTKKKKRTKKIDSLLKRLQIL